MIPTPLRTVLVFSAEDQAWIRRTPITLPDFWEGHNVTPAKGDLLRIGGRQFLIRGRVWEHDGEGPVLKLYVGDAHAPSDTSFG
ncbi:hypothetical protein [Hydrogenophaga palleronii]|uniref:hypothetical protein n=1 Tax=Hydrogenophaga palleronii TaxID=65655 RepID=UPI000824C926|nr:hypothetical protein [Hydrogenophaga palleronii]